MRQLFRSVFCLGLLALACSGCDRSVVPTAPTLVPAPITPIPAAAFAERYTAITVGEVVTSQVTADDPLCDEFPQFRCLYYRFTAPSSGNFEVVVNTTRAVGFQGQDVSVNAGGGEMWGPIGGQMSLTITTGVTYQITVWYAVPGVEFELRSSLTL